MAENLVRRNAKAPNARNMIEMRSVFATIGLNPNAPSSTPERARATRSSVSRIAAPTTRTAAPYLRDKSSCVFSTVCATTTPGLSGRIASGDLRPAAQGDWENSSTRSASRANTSNQQRYVNVGAARTGGKDLSTKTHETSRRKRNEWSCSFRAVLCVFVDKFFSRSRSANRRKAINQSARAPELLKRFGRSRAFRVVAECLRLGPCVGGRRRRG